MENTIYLIQCLKSMTVETLKELAKDNYVKGYSKLRKQELVQCLWIYLTSRNHVRNVMIHSSTEEIEIFIKAMSGSVIRNSANYLIGYWGERGLAYAVPDGRIYVPYDIQECVKKVMEDPEFENKRKKNELLEKYCMAFANLYQIIPVKQCVEIINQQNALDLTIPELIAWEEERYIARNGKWFVYQDGYITNDCFWVKDDPDYRELLKKQRNQPFYVPKRPHLLKYADISYVEETESYLELIQYLEQVYKMSHELVTELTLRMTLLIRGNYPMQALLDELKAYGIHTRSEYELTNLKSRISRLFFETRLPINRGYTPAELKQVNPERYEKIYGKLTYQEPAVKVEEPKGVSFQSTETMWSDAAPKKQPAKRIESKVYPNDPCPCGSGRKYKKCCGRS